MLILPYGPAKQQGVIDITEAAKRDAISLMEKAFDAK